MKYFFSSFTGGGNPVEISLASNAFAAGGEAQCFDFHWNGSSMVGKLFHLADFFTDPAEWNKFKLKFETYPDKLRLLADLSVSAVLPLGLIYSQESSKDPMIFRGYGMEKLDSDYVGIFKISDRKLKIRAFGQLVRIIQTLHLSGVVVGDVFYENIMVHKVTGDVKLIDSDSWSIGRFIERLINLEYTDPQLLDWSQPNPSDMLKLYQATPMTDLFVLAEIGFEIITGLHPFKAGISEHDPLTRLRNGISVYHADVSLRKDPTKEKISKHFIGFPNVAEYFENIFSKGLRYDDFPLDEIDKMAV